MGAKSSEMTAAEYLALINQTKPTKAKAKRKKPQLVEPTERVHAKPLADCAVAVTFASRELKLSARDALKIGDVWYIFLRDEPDAAWTTLEARLQKRGYYLNSLGWAREGGHYVSFVAWDDYYARR